MDALKSPKTSLWEQAVDRYRDELAENDDFQAVVEEGSLEGLLDYAKSSSKDVSERERTTLNSMHRLGPILKFVDDFAALAAIYLGADAKVTALFWGSIRLILRLSSSAGDTLQEVLDMLEELSLILPRFRTYERTLPLDRAFETSLLDVYTEVICFYARTIHFLRVNPHDLLRRNGWSTFQNDFNRTIRRIKRMSGVVEYEADLARMRMDKEKYSEVLQISQDLRESKLDEEEEDVQCWYVPRSVSRHFHGRLEALSAATAALKFDPSSRCVKTFAFYGMGGVGKTQTALQYAHESRREYSVVLWVAAENLMTLGHSYAEIARSMNLERKVEEEDASAAIMRVKAWLSETDRRWLLILDNVDSSVPLQNILPNASSGSILFTTRDFSTAYEMTSSSFQLQPFDDQEATELLLRLTNSPLSSKQHQERALAIVKSLGGLPLALSQMGGFIAQRKVPLHDFLPLYERNATKIDQRRIGLIDYEHTLSTVWDTSFAKLSGSSSHLQKLLSFFEPNAIGHDVLVEGARLAAEQDSELAFLCDELDFGDAEQALLQLSLLDKCTEDGTLSVHRLIQAAVFRRLSNEERSRYFTAVTRILKWGFPDTHSKDVGNQAHTWAKCEKCVPHVYHLVQLLRSHDIAAAEQQTYSELLLGCSWYLYERESYTIARELIEASLDNFENKTSLAFASATDLLGLIDLDLSDPRRALLPFQNALDIRRALLGPNDPFVAASLTNLALAHTELGNLEEAYEEHTKAIELRLSRNSDRIGNSYSNMSSLLLRMSKPDEAEDMLKRCPSLQNFTDETFIKTGNPRFSGDMVLLSRIRLQQGRDEEALRFSSKALAFRRKMLGSRLKTCDSLHDVAHMLAMQGNNCAALNFLQELVSIAEVLAEGDGQLARAAYRMSTLYTTQGKHQDAENWRGRAVAVRRKIRPDIGERTWNDASFSCLCLWMLW